MSNLQPDACPGIDKFAQKTFHYSQAIRVGTVCAGQAISPPIPTHTFGIQLIRQAETSLQ